MPPPAPFPPAPPLPPCFPKPPQDFSWIDVSCWCRSLDCVENQLCLHPAMNSPMCADPGRKVCETASPVRQIREGSLNVVSEEGQVSHELWVGIVEQLQGSSSAGAHLTSAELTNATTTAQGGHELQVAALGTHFMEWIGVVVGVPQEIPLDVGCPQHATSHHPLVFVHRCDSPGGDRPINSLDYVQFVTPGVPSMSTTKTGLTITACAVHHEGFSVDDPDQRFLAVRPAEDFLQSGQQGDNLTASKPSAHRAGRGKRSSSLMDWPIRFTRRPRNGAIMKNGPQPHTHYLLAAEFLPSPTPRLVNPLQQSQN